MSTQHRKMSTQHSTHVYVLKFTKNSVQNLNYPSTRRADNIHLKRPLTNSYCTSFEYQGLHVIIPY